MTEVVTARLEDWIVYPGGSQVHGKIYGDSKGRWEDGVSIHTSKVVSILRDDQKLDENTLLEGDIVVTRNSAYLLGKQYKEPVVELKTYNIKEKKMTNPEYRSNAYTPMELRNLAARGALAQQMLSYINYDFAAFSYEEYRDWKEAIREEYKNLSGEIKANKTGYMEVDGVQIEFPASKSERQANVAFMRKVASTYMNAMTFAKNVRRQVRESQAA